MKRREEGGEQSGKYGCLKCHGQAYLIGRLTGLRLTCPCGGGLWVVVSIMNCDVLALETCVPSALESSNRLAIDRVSIID